MKHKKPNQAEIRARIKRFLAGWEGTDARLRAVDKQCRRYELKLKQGQVKPRADSDLKTQAERYRAAAERDSARNSQVKALLSSKGVLYLQFFHYLSFARHIDKLMRQYSGQPLRIEALTAIGRWVTMGLDQKVLGAICEQVFNITLLV